MDSERNCVTVSVIHENRNCGRQKIRYRKIGRINRNIALNDGGKLQMRGRSGYPGLRGEGLNRSGGREGICVSVEFSNRGGRGSGNAMVIKSAFVLLVPVRFLNWNIELLLATISLGQCL